MEGSSRLRCEEPVQSKAQRLVFMFPSPALCPETHCLTFKPDNRWPGVLVILNCYRVSVERWVSEYKNTQEVTWNMKVFKRKQRLLSSLKDVEWDALVRKQPESCSEIGKGVAQVSGKDSETNWLTGIEMLLWGTMSKEDKEMNTRVLGNNKIWHLLTTTCSAHVMTYVMITIIL